MAFQRERLAVIGNGMAGIRAVEEVLARAPGRFEITIFGAEPHPAYNRILLSPLLAGEKQFSELVTHDLAWYAGNGLTLLAGEAAVAIDRDRGFVMGSRGSRVFYDRLLIATGSQPLRLPLPGADLPGVLTFRDIGDVEAMTRAASEGRRAVVIGGGLLGLEAAHGLSKRGLAVTVVHLMPSLMERQLDPAAADLLARDLRARGITVLTGANSKAILGGERVTGILLADGRALAADLVVMAAGIRPNADLGRAAGLDCNRGIRVDDAMRSSDPAIFAIGECVEHRGLCYGLVAPLYDMAAVAADHIAGAGTAAFTGAATATRLKVSGIDMFSAGDFAAAADREEIIFRDAARGIYKRLVLRDGVLCGAVLYGDASDGAWYFDLLSQGADLAGLRDSMIFGPALAEAA